MLYRTDVFSAQTCVYQWKVYRVTSDQLTTWSDNHSASQEIPKLLWNSKDYYSVHNSPQVVPILSYMYPVHTPPILSPSDQF